MQATEFRALLRLYGRKGPVRFPLPAQPLAIERAYATRIIDRILADALTLVRERVVPLLEGLAANASKVATMDAKDKELGDVMDKLSDDFFGKWTRRRMAKIVRSPAVSTAKFQSAQLNKQLAAAFVDGAAIDVVGNEPWLAPAIEEFTRENVALIGSVPEKFFSEIETMVAREVADGARFESMVAGIEERYGVAESRARLIARDQVSKFQGDLARVRQQNLGITSYTWRTVNDDRVRDDHRELDGKVFEWASPPKDGNPGEPIQCRCYAEPVIDLVI